MARRLVVLTLAWAALYAHTVSGRQEQPQSPPVFRSTVDAVELDVFITDRQGNPVRDLTADEFVLDEDGVRQSISSFALVDIPLKPPAADRADAIEPDVRNNRGPDGRLYVFAIDGMSDAMALRTRRFLRRFVETHFMEDDVAALVYLGHGQARNTQDFTNNRRLLLRAIDNVMGGAFAAADPLGGPGTSVGATPVMLAAFSPQLDYLGRGPAVLTQGLRALTESLAQIQGRRKVMLYFTQGIAMDVINMLEYSGGTRSIAFDDLHAAIGAATRGNVAIYPINPSGLTFSGSLATTMDLRALAYATGAEAVVNTNSIESGLARIVRENSSYYVLGYSSTNDRREGRFRNVRVRVSRPGLVVRTRTGYLEPLRRARGARMTPIGPMPPGLTQALEQPLANRTVPMQVFAAPYLAGDRQATVVVAQELDVNTLGLTAGENGTDEIAGATVAVRFDGKVYGVRQVSGPVAVADAAGGRTVRLISELQVPPGRYQLRVAGGTIDRAGSVMYDLEVPDFDKLRLSMSGVALTTTSAAATPTVDRSTYRLPLPGPVTSTREFAGGDTVYLYTEVYENQRRAAPHEVELLVELRTASGQVVRSVSQQRSSTDLAAGSRGFTIDVPLNGAVPGPHVLHVEARTSIGEPATVSRDIPIAIR